MLNPEYVNLELDIKDGSSVVFILVIQSHKTIYLNNNIINKCGNTDR